MHKIELHLIPTGASRANGQVERVMSTMKSMLTAVEIAERSWQDALSEVQLAMNCTTNRWCRRLFQQFAVDMYVKVETERLAFIRFNQAKLRSENYKHLRVAIHLDDDVQNIGRLTILPSSYIGIPGANER